MAITLLTAPILARLFSPAAYGVVGVFSTICGFLAAFSTLSYAQALPLTTKGTELRALFVLCGILLVASTLMVTVGAFLAKNLLAELFHEPGVARYAWCLPLLFAAGGVRSLLDGLLSCERCFAAIAVRGVLEVVVSRISQLGLCLAGFGSSPLVLFIGALTGSWLAALNSGFAAVRRIFKATTEAFQWQDVKEMAVKHRQFPLASLWNQTINTVTLGLPQLMLGFQYGVDSVAFYSMGTMLVGMPINLFVGSSFQAFYVEAADRLKRGLSAAPVSLQLTRLLLVFIPYPLIVVAFLGPMLFEIVFGPKWREAGIFAQILSPWLILAAYSSPLSSAYNMCERQGELFLVNMILLAGRFFALYYGGLYLGVRWTLAIFTFVGVLVNLHILWRCLGMLDVPRRAYVWEVVSAHIFPFVLIIPAAMFYWQFHSTVAAITALVFATVVYVWLTYRRNPVLLGQFGQTSVLYL